MPRPTSTTAPTCGLDMDGQQHEVSMHKRHIHEAWCNEHVNNQKFDHEQSTVRALLLVNEAWRNETLHLHHQQAHCKKLLAGMKSASSSSDCACIKGPSYRLLTHKYRAMNLLQAHFACEQKLEAAVNSLANTYANPQEMMTDLVYRYGPEKENVNPKFWLRSIEDKLATVNKRWREIGRKVKLEMRDRDNFPNVIRNLSIMRIFLEGSQAQSYGCDLSERARRDAFHQEVLDRLEQERKLFF